jgi:hypothetical protein
MCFEILVLGVQYFFNSCLLFPRLLLRMEDLLFHGEEVTRQICECGGGTMRTPFKHISEVANHNSGIEQNHTLAGLIGSLIK